MRGGWLAHGAWAGVVCAALASALAQTTLTNQKEIVRQARGSYYSLSGRGLSEFRCELEPDWDSILSNIKTTDVFREQVLPLLKTARFQVVVGRTGAAAVSHQFDKAPADQDVSNRLRDSTGGVEQIVSGFFETWSQFMINSPFPSPESDYRLEDRDGEYYLSFKQDSYDTTIVMSRDLVIAEVRASSPQVNGIVHTVFKRRHDKLVLESFNAEQGDSQKIAMDVQYQELDDFLLPSLVQASMKVGDSTAKVPIRFTGCRINGGPK